MTIAPIGAAIPAIQFPSVSSPGASGGQGFGDTLQQILNKVETTGAEANDAVGRMLDGSGDVHEAMIALQTSDLSMQLAMQVRNKFVQAYQEIMRMPV